MGDLEKIILSFAYAIVYCFIGLVVGLVTYDREFEPSFNEPRKKRFKKRMEEAYDDDSMELLSFFLGVGIIIGFLLTIFVFSSAYKRNFALAVINISWLIISAIFLGVIFYGIGVEIDWDIYHKKHPTKTKIKYTTKSADYFAQFMADAEHEEDAHWAELTARKKKIAATARKRKKRKARKKKRG